MQRLKANYYVHGECNNYYHCSIWVVQNGSLVSPRYVWPHVTELSGIDRKKNGAAVYVADANWVQLHLIRCAFPRVRWIYFTQLVLHLLLLVFNCARGNFCNQRSERRVEKRKKVEKVGGTAPCLSCANLDIWVASLEILISALSHDTHKLFN